jgi:hypothetical protein
VVSSRLDEGSRASRRPRTGHLTDRWNLAVRAVSVEINPIRFDRMFDAEADCPTGFNVLVSTNLAGSLVFAGGLHTAMACPTRHVSDGSSTWLAQPREFEADGCCPGIVCPRSGYPSRPSVRQKYTAAEENLLEMGMGGEGRGLRQMD